MEKQLISVLSGLLAFSVLMWTVAAIHWHYVVGETRLEATKKGVYCGIEVKNITLCYSLLEVLENPEYTFPPQNK